MNILGIIPARYASTRFPAKAMADIMGKSMIQRVYEQASKAKSLSKVVIATDHEEIYKHAKKINAEVILTSPDHPSGTDRCFEAYKNLDEDFDFVINIQGDEPFIQPEQIDMIASCLDKHVELATLVKKITDQETLFNPNTPKVILDKNQNAIYFSRQTIPYIRGATEDSWLKGHTFYKHIGIYAYRADILEKITMLKPSSLEQAECLEQLRWIENGFKIKVAITEYESQGIDTPEDLERVLKLHNQQ